VKDGPAYARKVLTWRCAQLAAMPPNSGRNTFLHDTSAYLFGMVFNGWISGVVVERELEAACSANGLSDPSDDGIKQCRASIASGRKWGLANPLPPALSDLGEDVPTVKVAPDGTFYDAETGEEIPPVAKSRPQPSNDDDALEALTYCDGLVGNIVDWICDTARRPNRIFALGAALTTIGTLIGRRVAGPTDSATHLYVLGLGATGAGKQTPMSRAKDLLFAADAYHLIGPGRFATGPAISNHLEEKPLSLCCQDEFGSFIARINKQNASGWEREASIIYRELWGLSFERYDGMRWALCHEHRLSTRRCATIREMKEGPSSSTIRC
jgi:hypothetical protein